VLSDAKAAAEAVKAVSPDTLVSEPGHLSSFTEADSCCQVVLDAVCSVASEEIQMDAWGIDVIMTASQKGLGTPPGLSILVASPRAIAVSFPPFFFDSTRMQICLSGLRTTEQPRDIILCKLAQVSALRTLLRSDAEPSRAAGSRS
jgi:hypothetical protein